MTNLAHIRDVSSNEDIWIDHISLHLQEIICADIYTQSLKSLQTIKKEGSGRGKKSSSEKRGKGRGRRKG